jgi:hypothetical protein
MRALASAFYANLETTTEGLLFFQDRTAPNECNPNIHLRWKAGCASSSLERFGQTHRVPSLVASLLRGHRTTERSMDHELPLDISPKASLPFSRQAVPILLPNYL